MAKKRHKKPHNNKLSRFWKRIKPSVLEGVKQVLIRVVVESFLTWSGIKANTGASTGGFTSIFALLKKLLR